MGLIFKDGSVRDPSKGSEALNWLYSDDDQSMHFTFQSPNQIQAEGLNSCWPLEDIVQMIADPKVAEEITEQLATLARRCRGVGNDGMADRLIKTATRIFDAWYDAQGDNT